MVSSVMSVPDRTERTPGRAAAQASSLSPSTPRRTTGRPARRRTSRVEPAVTSRPRSRIAIESASDSTTSIWWVEKISVRPWAASSRKAARRSETLTGSRPVNGSSIRTTSGSWRIAAMNWTFCWLPLLSSSAFRPASSGTRKRSSQSSASRRASRGGTPYSPAKNTSCSRIRIRGYRPRSSGR